MKPSFRSLQLSYLKAVLLIVQLALCFGDPTVAQAGGRNSSAAAVRPGLNDRPEVPQGYLMVYSATDPFDDGDAWYYAHSSYSIFTIQGKLFKNVENHISRSDELPTLVTLPAGSYIIDARSERRGYVRVPVVISAGRRTVLDPDQEETDLVKQLGRTKHAHRLASQ